MNDAMCLPYHAEPHELLSRLDGLGRPHVLVVGDLILDRYTWGRAERISPEAPVPVLRFDEEEDRLGGAAAVARLLRALECEVTCLGLVGEDADGRALLRLLTAEGIDHGVCGMDAGRRTTVKQRFLSRAHGHAQMLRLDRETCAPLPETWRRRWSAAVFSSQRSWQAILISDYGKGVCSPALVREVIEWAGEWNCPVLVDPARGVDPAMYAGATALAPNRVETELATGRRIVEPADAAAEGEEFCRRHGIATAVIKLDSQGIVLARAEGSLHLGTQPRAVYDITGAGDSVLAVLGLCAAEGLAWETSCALANVAGGLQVERVGVAPIRRQELRDDLRRQLVAPVCDGPQAAARRTEGKIVSLSQAAAIAARERRGGRRVVLTNGCFAALHAGHVSYLRQAKGIGDVLIVAINSSSSIRRLKGDRPIIADADRLALMGALDCVDHVLLFEEDTPHRVLAEVRPDVLVKGGTTDEIVGREVVEAYGGQVVRLDAVHGISTTQLLRVDESTAGRVERGSLVERAGSLVVTE